MSMLPVDRVGEAETVPLAPGFYRMSESPKSSSQPKRSIERIVNKADGFEAADQWDREQHRSLSPQERMQAARTLKMRAFPADAPDVRECHGR